MPTDFRTRLAQATRAAHAATEARIDLHADASRERYIAYLGAMHAVTRAAERALATDARLAAFGLDQRRKTPWLERDLRQLGVAANVARQTVHVPADPHARIGWAYVLEGATLGARVLYRELAPRWDLTPERGAAFLFGYGERTSAMWQAFVAALNALDPGPESEKACIAGAVQAFESVGEAFRASIPRAHLGVRPVGVDS